MKIVAAVARQPHEEFSVEVLELAPPGPHEVLVEVRGVGLCHTDLVARDQEYPVPLPAVLGHEGAGIVVEVGSAVTSVRPGRRVVCSFHSCGTCRLCRTGRISYCESAFPLNFGCRRADDTTPLSSGDEAIGGAFFGQSTFATHAVVHERSLVPVDDDCPVELLGPLGCGVQTGAGAVLNALRPSPLSRLVVFGAGSVGLSAVMAAAVSGCRQIVAVDTKPSRLALAAELGATDTVDASTVDALSAVRDLTDGGADYTLEVTGNPAVARQAVEALVPGGVCGLIGAAPMGALGSFDMNQILFGRTVRGIIEGDAVPQVFIPQLVDLWRAGRFPFDRLVRRYRLDAINDAVRDAESGATVKAVLEP